MRALAKGREKDAPVVDASVFGLDGEHSVWCFCVNDLHGIGRQPGEKSRRPKKGRGSHIVVVAVRAVLVRLFVRLHVLPKGLFALFAEERHLVRLDERVIGRLGVAFGALSGFRVSSGQQVHVSDGHARRTTFGNTVRGWRLGR